MASKSIQASIDKILLATVIVTSAGSILGIESLMISERKVRHEFLAQSTSTELIDQLTPVQHELTAERLKSELNNLSNVRVATWVTDGKNQTILPDNISTRHLLKPALLKNASYQSIQAAEPHYFRSGGILYFTCAMQLPSNLKLQGSNAPLTIRFLEDTARTPLSTPLGTIKLSLILIALSAVLVLAMRQGLARALSPLEQLEQALDNFSLSPGMEKSLSPLEPEQYPRELQKLIKTFNTLIQRVTEQFTNSQFFVSAVSHEMRNQLTLIQGYSSRMTRYINNHSSTEKLLKVVDDIHTTNTDALVTLTNLVELARAESQSIHINITPLSSRSLLSSLSQAEQSVGTDPVVVAECIDRQILADESILRASIQSLIENAKKYAATGRGVELYGHPLTSDSYYVIDVRDFGEGIPEDSLDSIFDRFVRGSNSAEKSGTGLGLAVVKETLALIDVTIEAPAHSYGEGAVFRLRVPLAPS